MYLIISQDVGDAIIFFNSLGAFSVIFFIFLVIIEVTLAPVPPLMLYVLAGVLFGAFWGGTLTLFGNLIGSLIDFEIARSYGRKFVEGLATSKVKKRFDNFFGKYGGFSIFLLRINPLTTTDLFSYLAGLTNMKRTHFILGTALGLIPLIYVQTYFGEIFVKENKILYSIVIAVSLLYLALILYFLISSFIKKVKEGRKSISH